MKYNLIKCGEDDCRETSLSTDLTCPSCGSSRCKISQPKARDFVNAWEQDLESANRHSLTEMPTDIYNILREEIKDEAILLRVISKMYIFGLGV